MWKPKIRRCGNAALIYADSFPLAGVATGSQWPKLALHPTLAKVTVKPQKKRFPSQKVNSYKIRSFLFCSFQSVQPWCSKFAIKTFITGMFISRIQMQWLIHVKAQSAPKPVQVRLLHAPVQILEYGFRFMQRVVHLSIGHNLLSRDWSASLACENLPLCKMCRQCSFLYFTKLFVGKGVVGKSRRVFIGPMCTWGPIIGSPCHSLRPRAFWNLLKT